MTYVPLREPWAHQRKALDRLEGRREFALLMAMRTGKTKVALDDFGRLWFNGEVDDLLVIAPAGVYRTWQTATDEHVGPPLRELLTGFLWSAQDGKEKRAKLTEFMLKRVPRVLLVNVEALSSVERARLLCLEFVSQRRCMVVVDESTTIKNHKSARTKFIVDKLAPRASHRRILTGLITPKSPLDLFSQFEFLRPGILGFTNYWSFRARYAKIRKIVVGGRSVDVVDGFRDTGELASRISPHSFRVELRDCYDLPPKIYQIREVAMTPEQRRAYDDMKKYSTTMLEGEHHVTATQVITQILRLHQILCGHVTDEQGVRCSLPENRTSELISLLEEHEGKAIVWCSYDADVRRVAKALEDSRGAGTVSCFWGGNRSTREDEERAFQTDPQVTTMVATAAAGGRGRLWSAADLCIYYSNTNDLEHRSQSEERPQAVDKKTSVLYVDLVVPNTVDDRVILRSLREKIDMADAINGTNWREWVV